MPSEMAVDDSIRLMWNGGERIHSFAFILSVCLCAVLCVGFVWGISTAGRGGKIELESRINPNDASVASLVRLSGVGESRAAAIVAYRDEYVLSGGQGPAFGDCNDLQKVKGIGPKTVQSNRRWLKFE